MSDLFHNGQTSMKDEEIVPLQATSTNLTLPHKLMLFAIKRSQESNDVDTYVTTDDCFRHCCHTDDDTLIVVEDPTRRSRRSPKQC